jgi:hypothetical protein
MECGGLAAAFQVYKILTGVGNRDFNWHQQPSDVSYL